MYEGADPTAELIVHRSIKGMDKHWGTPLQIAGICCMPMHTYYIRLEQMTINYSTGRESLTH